MKRTMLTNAIIEAVGLTIIGLYPPIMNGYVNGPNSANKNTIMANKAKSPDDGVGSIATIANVTKSAVALAVISKRLRVILFILAAFFLTQSYAII